MVRAALRTMEEHDDKPHFMALREGLAAVLAIVERDQRARLADELEEHAAELWRTRRGEVGIEYVNGVEAAAHQLRSGGTVKCGNRGFAGAAGCWREAGHEGNHIW